MKISKNLESKLFENLISKEEIAKEFGLSPATVANWMSSGKLPCIRIGRKNMALRSAIETWINGKGRLDR